VELNLAAQAWSYPNISCTSVSIVVAQPAWRRIASEDGINLVVFRERAWCHNERCSHTTVFPSSAVAMTTVYPEGAGADQVREADIEINARWFAAANPRLKDSDLRAILVHELGHVLGLKDACGLDHGGAAVDPGCSDDERASVMFAPNHLERPTERDIRLVCALHPRSKQDEQASSNALSGGQSSSGLSVEVEQRRSDGESSGITKQHWFLACLLLIGVGFGWRLFVQRGKSARGVDS
jgi:hypothetical protein